LCRGTGATGLSPLALHAALPILMADVSALLSSSLDYETVLARMTQMLVPGLADWCAVDVLDEHGRVARVSVYHSNRRGPARASADRKSTGLNSSHVKISYAAFCL